MALTTEKKHGSFRSAGEKILNRFIRMNGYVPRYEDPNDTIDYIIPETKHKYHSDFVLDKIAGGKMFIEYKGLWHLEDRKKHLYIKKQYPDLDIRIIFEKPQNKIKKGSKTTYAAWCDAKGLKWAAKTMPKSWLLECVKPNPQKATNLEEQH